VAKTKIPFVHKVIQDDTRPGVESGHAPERTRIKSVLALTGVRKKNDLVLEISTQGAGRSRATGSVDAPGVVRGENTRLLIKLNIENVVVLAGAVAHYRRAAAL
jgi:hypothetical protein